MRTSHSAGPADPPNLPSRNPYHKGEVGHVSRHHGPSANNYPPSHFDGRHAYGLSTDGCAVAYGHTDLLLIIAALEAASRIDRTGISIVGEHNARSDEDAGAQ